MVVFGVVVFGEFVRGDEVIVIEIDYKFESFLMIVLSFKW